MAALADAFDQAAGLRRIFGRPRAPALVVLAGLGASGGELAALCAAHARSRGLVPVLVPTSGDAGEDARLARLRAECDLLLVEALGAPPLAVLCADASLAVLPLSPTATGLTAAYAQLKACAEALAGREIQVVAVGGRAPAPARSAFDNLQRLTSAQLGIRLAWLGWLPGESLAPDAAQLAGSRARASAERLAARLVERISRRSRDSMPSAGSSSPQHYGIPA